LTKVLISTSCRYAPPSQPSGYLLVYDLDEDRIVRKCQIIEPPYRDADPNPRGGVRGLKGISIKKNHIAIANASTIFIYDHEWNPIHYFFHPICAGIHDIELNEKNDAVWVSSSRNDLLVCLDFFGKVQAHYDLRRFSLIRALATRKIKPYLSEKQIRSGSPNYRDPRTHDLAMTDALHVNSFAFLANGDLLISCGLFRIINNESLHRINNFVKINPVLNNVSHLFKKVRSKIRSTKNHFEDKPISSRKSISLLLRIPRTGDVKNSLLLEDCKYPSHSIRLLDNNSALYLNTTSGEVIHFNPITDEIFSSKKIGEKFLRGATQLPDWTVLIGDNHDLLNYDLENQQTIKKMRVTEDPNEAIFDIQILPDWFSLPPQSFEEWHYKKLPVNQEDW
jgi:hypothetical protein